jgi:hypothetical protein
MFLAIAKLLEGLVARDGIERRRPFQGRLPNRRSGLKSTDVNEGEGAYDISDLGWFRMFAAVLGSSMFAYCARRRNSFIESPSSICVLGFFGCHFRAQKGKASRRA